MIPKTTPEVIIKVLEQFDQELRETADWSSWEQNENHKFAIQHNGRLYPVKKIISLATNTPVNSFSGGNEANGYMDGLGFTIVQLRGNRLSKNNDKQDKDDQLVSLDNEVSHVIEAIALSGFYFEPWQIATYITAIRTKPFVILAGVSGTGKSKLPALVAKITGSKSKLLPVRPDWTDSSDVLGYCDLQGNFRPGPLLEFAREADERRDKHFICILDEMNLARVEQYFAEVLSRIEDWQFAEDGGYESGPLISIALNESDAVC